MKIIIGIIVIILILIFINTLSKKRKIKKHKAMLANDKLREEALDKLLMNTEAEVKRDDRTFAAVPVAVNYDANLIEKADSAKKKKNKPKKIMVQIIENSELSARKYVLDPGKGIFIGSKVGKNHIVIGNENVDERQCEIREKAGKVYVHNIGTSGKVILKRGKQRVYVEQNYLEIKTGDALVIADTVYKMELISTAQI